MAAIVLVAMETGIQQKKSNTFFTLWTILHAIAKKFVHILKDEKKSYLPGVCVVP